MGVRRFKYYDLDQPDGKIYTEDQIIEEYWDYWSIKMTEVGRQDLISRDSCIQDWCTINWAFEIFDNDKV